MLFCNSVTLSQKDAKLGKKCTLLDLSRHLGVAASGAQQAAVSSGEAKDQDISKSAPDPPMTVEESKEEMEEEKKHGVDEKEKSEELSADGSPAEMEVDPTDAPIEEMQSTTVSNRTVFNCMWLKSCALHLNHY